MPKIILLGYFVTGQVHDFPSKHFHRPNSVSDTEADSCCILVIAHTSLGIQRFSESPPLASRKGRTPRWKYFARMFFTVKVAQNSCRRFSLSGSEKNPFPVEFLPRFTGQDGSCQGALKWIMSHYSQSCLRFMEMFVETIADSSADSLLLLCNF